MKLDCNTMNAFEMDDTSEDSSEQRDPKKSERGNWANQMDYIMSVLGSIVGYGNLWRFPYLCNRNGGGAFLIPFLFFLVTCGLPLFFLEVSLGQFAGKSNVHVWGICPLFKGIGIGQFIACTLTIIYYQNIIAWSIYYMGMSCSSILPWTTCSNYWNTDFCLTESGNGHNISHTGYGLDNWTTLVNHTLITKGNESRLSEFTFSHSDAEEFWQYKALAVSEGVHQPGRIQWHLALSLFASWFLIFLCLIKGVRSVGKVVYVTAILPYILLLVLLIRTLFLPGSVDGILFYLKPDFKKLLELQVWLEALIQVFYSLGPGWGFVIALSSYNRFHDNTLRNSLIVTFVGEGTSLFSGLVIFTVLGFMAHKAGVGVSEVASSGPGLAFVAYPEGLSELPVPQLWAFLFFVMMITVGLDSQFSWAETLITAVLDQFPHKLRRRRILVTAVFCMVYFLLGLPFTTEGGIYYFQLVDWYTGSVCVILFGVLESIIFMWIYGVKRFSDDVELMLGRRVPMMFNVLLGYVTPTFLSISLLLVLWQFQPPTYGKYVYPVSCRIAGWVIASLPVIPIPVMAVVALYKAKGTFLERLKEASRPDKSWKPAQTKYQELYDERNGSSDFSCFNPCRS